MIVFLTLLALISLTITLRIKKGKFFRQARYSEEPNVAFVFLILSIIFTVIILLCALGS